MRDMKFIKMLCVVFSVLCSASTAFAATSLPDKGSVLFPHITISNSKVEYSPSRRLVSGSLSIATQEKFSSSGIHIAVGLVNNSNNLLVYRKVQDAQYTVSPNETIAINYSYNLPSVLSTGQYHAVVNILSPTGELLQNSILITPVPVNQPTHAYVLVATDQRLQSDTAIVSLSAGTLLNKGTDAKFLLSLPATNIVGVSVIPEIKLTRSVRLGLSGIYRTIYGEKILLGTSPVLVSLRLPTDMDGLYFGTIQLNDTSISGNSISNPLQFSYRVGSDYAVLGGLALQNINQYGPFTKVNGVAVINFNKAPGAKSSIVSIDLKNKQGRVIKTSLTILSGYSGLVEVPFSFLVFGSLNARDYTVSTSLSESNSITGQLPNRSGTLVFILILSVLIAFLSFIMTFIISKLKYPRTAAMVMALFTVGMLHFYSVSKVYAADEFNITNTTFSPTEGTNLGNFSACGQPNGTDYINNTGCKIIINGSLAFDGRYLKYANGGYDGSTQTWRYDYLEYQVFVNGVLMADPYDLDSKIITLSSTGSSNGNDTFSFALTTHFTGKYQIKLIPHYYYYFNSCGILNSENCTHAFWLSDSATFTATVLPNKPALNLPSTISNPSGSSSVSMNYQSSGLTSFTLTDSTGAASYPTQVTVGSGGNYSLTTNIAQLPVTRTPTQMLTASGRGISDEPNSTSTQQLADPFALRQGDYQKWEYTEYVSNAQQVTFKDPTSLYHDADSNLRHDPVLYPGDQLDYSRAQNVVSNYAAGCIFISGPGCSSSKATIDVYIPVKRFGTVNSIPNDDAQHGSLVQTCSMDKYYEIDNRYSNMQNGGNCTVTNSPTIYTGDTLLPFALSNINTKSVQDTACLFAIGTPCRNVFSSTYTKTRVVTRDYSGKTRVLFPIDQTTAPVTANTAIVTGVTSPISPSVLLTGPATVAEGNPINLNLSDTNFSGKSSGIVITPGVFSSSSTCLMLGGNGGSCTDMQYPVTTSVYTYQGWVCDGLNETGTCLTSNTVPVTVTISLAGPSLTAALTPTNISATANATNTYSQVFSGTAQSPSGGQIRLTFSCGNGAVEQTHTISSGASATFTVCNYTPNVYTATMTATQAGTNPNTATAQVSVAQFVGGGGNPPLSYVLTGPTGSVDSGARYVLTATHASSTPVASLVTFQCYGIDALHTTADLPHAVTIHDAIGSFSYSCPGTVNSGALSATVLSTASASAPLLDALSLGPVSVTVLPVGQAVPPIVAVLNNYFCAGD